MNAGEIRKTGDSLVNAANEHLGHYGGVAAAINDAGGRVIVYYINQDLQEIATLTVKELQQKGYLTGKIRFLIQKESDDYIEQYGYLAVSDTAVTNCGNMPCKKVIHTVGPQYPRASFFSFKRHKKSRKKEEDLTQLLQKANQIGEPFNEKEISNQISKKEKATRDLQKTIENSLQKADEMKMESISIPTISAGVFGFPKKLATETIFKAVKDYCDSTPNTSRHLKNIRLISTDQASIDLYEKASIDLYEKQQ